MVVIAFWVWTKLPLHAFQTLYKFQRYQSETFTPQPQKQTVLPFAVATSNLPIVTQEETESKADRKRLGLLLLSLGVIPGWSKKTQRSHMPKVLHKSRWDPGRPMVSDLQE